MKRLIIIILIMLFVPISYVSAGDRDTVNLSKNRILLSSSLDSVEKQRQKIGFDRMDEKNEITNFMNLYKKGKVTVPSFDWKFIPDFNEGHPSGMIQFTFTF